MTVSRRFFLKGLGATVAIPALPSLLTPREARAQAATPSPCFASYMTNHGHIWAENMFPDGAGAIPPPGLETATHAGRTIRRFPLAAVRSGEVATVSPVLSAPATLLTPALLGKMSTVQGVGIPWYIAHQWGANLGNYAARCEHGGIETGEVPPAPRRTVDQIMGWSSAFYPSLSGVRQRVMVTSGKASYNYSDPATRTGAIEEVAPFQTPAALFDDLFPQTGTPTQRRPIVDRVRESYQRLRSSARISAQDRRRLDEHVERLREVERRLGSVVSCGAVNRPTNPSLGLAAGQVSELVPRAGAQAEWHQAWNDVVVLAFSCGVSRVATTRVDFLFSDYTSDDWHSQIAHQGDVPANQQKLYEAQQRVFAGVVADLASKLDAVDMGDGTTLLDRTLVAWTQESGNQTHDSATVPVVCFGGAHGFLRTGYHQDYRNLDMKLAASETVNPRYPGLLWNQWLGTVLQAMRIPPGEWENRAVCGGYPDYAHANAGTAAFTAQAWPQAVWTAAGEVLPWLAAT